MSPTTHIERDILKSEALNLYKQTQEKNAQIEELMEEIDLKDLAIEAEREKAEMDMMRCEFVACTHYGEM